MTTEQFILDTLNRALLPQHLEVINESHRHNVPANSATHFKVVIVSDQFADQALIDRHRRVNGLLAEALDNGIHALSLQTKTPQEWAKQGGVTLESPPCLGGDGSL